VCMFEGGRGRRGGATRRSANTHKKEDHEEKNKKKRGKPPHSAHRNSQNTRRTPLHGSTQGHGTAKRTVAALVSDLYDR
jgi:hypothetical protein